MNETGKSYKIYGMIFYIRTYNGRKVKGADRKRQRNLKGQKGIERIRKGLKESGRD